MLDYVDVDEYPTPILKGLFAEDSPSVNSIDILPKLDKEQRLKVYNEVYKHIKCFIDRDDRAFYSLADGRTGKELP